MGIFFGGRSGEHEVSLLSARSIISNLDPSKYNLIEVGITREGKWLSGERVLDAFQKGATAHLQPVAMFPQAGDHHLYRLIDGQYHPQIHLDVVFPVLHGTFGEDGTLQGFLELIGIAYVGAGVLASSVGMDKGLFKSVLRSYEIPVLDHQLITRRQVEEDLEQAIRMIESALSYPIFVKPANLGSSVGITKCRNRSDLGEGLYEAARYDRRIVVEQGLERPREIEVSVLGNDQPVVSIPGEVVPGEDFYTYSAKYLSDSSELLIPAPLSDEQTREIQRIAVQTYRAIDCSGMARVDFLLDRQTERVYVSEVNTIPGFTQISMYPKLWEASGLPYTKLLDRLIELAFERKADRDRTEFHYRREE
ncbi:MAG: D-alanine--D-alanine ligase [Bellilinea sp.]|nr:MAG: D-alanine--D-alanine ligase [Bellilinea sp.]